MNLKFLINHKKHIYFSIEIFNSSEKFFFLIFQVIFDAHFEIDKLIQIYVITTLILITGKTFLSKTISILNLEEKLLINDARIFTVQSIFKRYLWMNLCVCRVPTAKYKHTISLLVIKTSSPTRTFFFFSQILMFYKSFNVTLKSCYKYK